MTPADTATADALRALRERFRTSSGNTVAAFRRLATQLGTSPTGGEVLDALRRELHRVRGTAGTFGFTEASRLAGVLEERVVRWAADPALDGDRRGAIIDHFATALELAFRESVDAADGDGRPAARRLLLIDVPVAVADKLRAEAAIRGYQVVVRNAPEAAVAAAREAAPHVVICSGRGRDAGLSASGVASAPLLVLVEGSDAPRQRTPGDDRETVIGAATAAETVFEIADRLASRASVAGGTVLVVDDDPSMLAIVRHILEGAGLHVETLADPSALEHAIERATPSLVLMDIEMPGQDGISLTRRLRTLPSLAELPVILFSTRADESTREAAYLAGADEFVAKPIAAAELRARIADRLERERLRRLAVGLHPATGLPVAPRSEREAAARFAAARRAGQPAVVVVIRSLAPLAPDDEPAWLRESTRLSAGLGGIGYGVGLALLAVLAAEPAQVAERLAALQQLRPGAAPSWHAAFAVADDIGGDDFAAVRRAAQSISDAARPDGPLVARWARDLVAAAPDVVVVEDDPALSGMLQYALRASGFSFRTFGNGAEALEALLVMQTGTRRPVVLLDVDLPGMDGFTIHERLRLERPGAFAVVFSTVHAAETEQLRAYRGGALDYVTKPLNLRVLMAKIPGWLERAGRSA